MTLNAWTGVLLFIAFSAGCAGPPRAVQSALAKPTRIEAFRVAPTGTGASAATPGGESIAGYPVTAGPFEPDPEAARRMIDALRSPLTYAVPVASKGCMFLPGVALRLWGGTGPTDVLICFRCDEVKFVTHDSTGRENVTYKDATPGRATLVAAVKGVFPEDPEIQALRAAPSE